MFLLIKHETWDVTSGKVRVLCEAGRIEGTAKLGREWAIPIDAERPVDKRVTSGEYKDWRRKSRNDTEGHD